MSGSVRILTESLLTICAKFLNSSGAKDDTEMRWYTVQSAMDASKTSCRNEWVMEKC